MANIFDRLLGRNKTDNIEARLRLLESDHQQVVENKDAEIHQLRESVDITTRNSQIVEDAVRRLMIEDNQWFNMNSGTSTTVDLSPSQRRRLAKEAWDGYSFNPRIYRTVTMFRTMIVSKNLIIKSNEPDIHAPIQEFISERRNKWLFTLTALVNRMILEGEIYIRFWILKDKKVIFREIPPSEIIDIVRNPNDRGTELYYKKIIPSKSGANPYTVSSRLETTMNQSGAYEYIPSVEVKYYEDVQKVLLNTPEFQKNLKQFRFSMSDRSVATIQQIASVRQNDNDLVSTISSSLSEDDIDFNSFILHITYPSLCDRFRGFSLLQPILKAAKQYREFIQTRLHLARLRSNIVYDIAVDGSPGDVLTEATKHRFPPAPGTVNVHSAKITHSFIYPQTGADDVRGDVRALGLEFVAGSLLPEHVATGDASNANFASLRDTKFSFASIVESWQDVWDYTLREMFRFVLLAAEVPEKVDVPYEFADESEKFKKISLKKDAVELISISMPQVTGETILELSQATQIWRDLDIASKDTIAAKLGLDRRNRELALIKAEREEELQDFVKNEMVTRAVIGPEQPGPGGAGGQISPPTLGAPTSKTVKKTPNQPPAK